MILENICQRCLGKGKGCVVCSGKGSVLRTALDLFIEMPTGTRFKYQDVIYKKVSVYVNGLKNYYWCFNIEANEAHHCQTIFLPGTTLEILDASNNETH